MSRKAIILAAGLGSRLHHLTDDRPKALVEYQGQTLLEHVILKLRESGFRDVIINIHHYPDQIIDFVRARNSFDIHIEFSDEREMLLDTGGGIKQAGWFFDDRPFLVHNVDIYSNIDLEKLYQYHLGHAPLATLAVKERDTSRSLLMTGENLLAGWKDNRSDEERIIRKNVQTIPIAFSAIHVIDPAIFKLFGNKRIFSIIDAYLDLGADHDIRLYRHDRDTWKDMGKLDSYEKYI